MRRAPTHRLHLTSISSPTHHLPSSYVLGNSKQKTPSGDALYTPNMQPGGYGGEFARDYTYGVVHTPWANPARAAAAARWNLTLDGFVWATEHLLAGQQAGTGLMPDAVSATGAAFNKCFQQYCTFPPSSPLPRPSCCAHGNCTIGSMDNAAFATFNALFLVRATADRRGAPAGAALLARWLPALERGLAQIPTGPAGSVAASLAFNDPASPVVGYGFEDTVAKTGALHFASLLLLEASATLCQAIRRYSTHHAGLFRRSGAADALCDQARNISAALGPALWDERIGMFKPATGLEGNLTDIWGSAYAASLDGVHTMMGGADAWPVDVPPPVTAAQRSRIVSFLAQAPNGIFAAGQARHLPVGQGWTQSWCVPAGAGPGGPPCRVGFNYNPGGYQDGGFWATPVHHIWPLLHRTPATRALACSLLRDFVTSVHAGGPGTDVMRAINEWVDAHGKPHGAAGYVASASNPAAAATTMAAGGGCSY